MANKATENRRSKKNMLVDGNGQVRKFNSPKEAEEFARNQHRHSFQIVEFPNERKWGLRKQ